MQNQPSFGSSASDVYRYRLLGRQAFSKYICSLATTIIFIGFLIFCAHLFSALFRRSRVPDVLLLLLIGIFIGPVLHWVTPQMLGEGGTLLSSLTLLFVLFDSGVDMSLDSIRRHWKAMVQITFLSSIVACVLVMVAAYFLLGFGWHEGLLLGSMVSGTAAAIVIPLVRQMRVSERTRTILTLESAVSGVLSVVVALAIIEGYTKGSLKPVEIIGTVLASIAMAFVIGVMGGIIWASLLDNVRHLQNSMFLTPAFLFVLFGVTEAMGYSGAIAALAFGLVLGNTSYFEFSFLRKLSYRMRPLVHKEKSFFKEFVFLLKSLFFVYIGISIPLSDVNVLLYGAALTAVLFLGRFLLVFIVGRKNSRNDRCIVSMVFPKGLVSAVLASMPLQVNAAAGYQLIPHAELICNVVYSVVFCSILITSLAVFFTRRSFIDPDVPSTYYKEVYDYE